MSQRKNFMLCALFFIFFALQFTGCSPSNPNTEQNETIDQLAEDYFEASLALDPFNAPEYGFYQYNAILVDTNTDEFLKKKHELNHKFLDQLKTIDRHLLSEQQKLTFDILKRELEYLIIEERYPSRFLPMDQFYSIPVEFARYGSGEAAQPFQTPEDYQNFIKKMKGFRQWSNSAIARMEEGTQSHVVLPKVLVQRMIHQFDAQLVKEIHQSPFYGPLNRIPMHWSEEDKQTTMKEYTQALHTYVFPTYQKLADYLRQTYLIKARGTSGLWDIPNGKEWYQFLSNEHTTTTTPVSEIHQLGLNEVTRIHTQMREVQNNLNISGNFRSFLSKMTTDPDFFFPDNESLLSAYRTTGKQIAQKLPEYFVSIPKSQYEIRAVEDYRAASAAAASYVAGSPDGSRNGIFYLNTRDLKAQPKWGVVTLSLHEAEPGHHFQVSLSQEQTGLPTFRRFGSYTAFEEGWALYSEHLGVEMGLFDDPLQYFGKLSDELLRAMRLVVDTGIHAKGWTREQAIHYMLSNSAMSKSDVIAEVERYMAIPGQALSYKIGQLKILDLRKKAKKTLGKQFVLKEFHEQVLIDGAMPLDILEAKIDRWIAQKRI